MWAPRCQLYLPHRHLLGAQTDNRWTSRKQKRALPAQLTRELRATSVSYLLAGNGIRGPRAVENSGLAGSLSSIVAGGAQQTREQTPRGDLADPSNGVRDPTSNPAKIFARSAIRPDHLPLSKASCKKTTEFAEREEHRRRLFSVHAVGRGQTSDWEGSPQSGERVSGTSTGA
jgi:hypothetical protein